MLLRQVKIQFSLLALSMAVAIAAIGRFSCKFSDKLATMNLNRSVHQILKILTEEKEVWTSKAVTQDHFRWVTVKRLSHELKKKPTEIRYSIGLLAKNEHVERLSAGNILDVKAKATPLGEEAFQTSYYAKLAKNESAADSINWRQRNWFFISLFSFALGLVSPIVVEYAKTKLLPSSKREPDRAFMQKDSTPTIK